MTVVNLAVAVVLTQALDVACDGTRDVVFWSHNRPAAPGECLIYRITVSVSGDPDPRLKTQPVIDSPMPQYTKIETCSDACLYSVTDGGNRTFDQTGEVGFLMPAQGQNGPIVIPLGELTVGQRRVFEFTVIIDH